VINSLNLLSILRVVYLKQIWWGFIPRLHCDAMIGCPERDYSVIKWAWSETHLHTLFGKMTFGELTFGDLTFGELTFGEMTFGEVLGNQKQQLFFFAILYMIRCLTGSQWNKSRRVGMICSFQRAPVTTRAAACSTECNFLITPSLTPKRMAL